MSIVIKAEDISKMYRLGLVNSGTLHDDLKRIWYKWRGKEDPFLQIGEENKRDVSGGNYVWALKDINFEVKHGEVLGIIGRNGAGKSTLLKLLSKVTKPSTGKILTKGRIASLLEVGTGFHPELTGRENIFLNGAILGMKKYEIKSKFDEIVNFSGCERYIDTPVKRYSSGMYVRLAFAVAAHLEPEILIVDEVLAVGDINFQKKCIGKMKDVANRGRTVLFVSHNLNSIQNLCDRGLLIENGRIIENDSIQKVIEKYRKSSMNLEIGTKESIQKRTKGKIVGGIRFKKIELFNSLNEQTNIYSQNEDVILKFKLLKEHQKLKDVIFSLSIYAEESEINLASSEQINISSLIDNKEKEIEYGIKIKKLNLKPGIYVLYFCLMSNHGSTLIYDALNLQTSPIRINIISEQNIRFKNSSYINLKTELI